MAETEDAPGAAEEEGVVAVAAETEPEGPPPSLEPPYTRESLEAIRTFFQRRKKNAVDFNYTSTGDLETKEGARISAKGTVVPAGVINLKRFVPLEVTDLAALEEFRLEEIARLEGLYETELITLRTAWADYAISGNMREVLAANQRVAELDARRSAIRSAVRDVLFEDNPVTKKILFDQPYEERKLFYRKKDFFKELLARVIYHDFKPEQDRGKYVVDEDVEGALAAAAAETAAGGPDETAFRKTLKDGRKARIFFDTDSPINGFLSPMWPVEFVINETRYAFALQAYEAERARELNKMDLRANILNTRSARTVRLLTRNITAHPADARGLWMKIFTAIYQQHPHLKEKLLSTGTDSLIYADSRKGPSGVGITEESSYVLDPVKWEGENLVGVVLESIRTRLREETLEEAPAEVATGGAITEAEQQKAKIGAIINARRFGGGR